MELHCVLAWRLGLPLFQEGDACKGCGHTLHSFGDHVTTCTILPSRTRQHNALRDALFYLLKTSGIRPQCEVSLDNSVMRPADVFLPTFERGCSLAIDVPIGHPFRTKLVLGNISVRLRLRQGESRKAQSCTLCLTHGHQFLVFNAETLEGFSIPNT